MHEYMLYGQIPAQRHDQVLNILAGVAAVQPVSYEEQHLLFEPLENINALAVRKRKGQNVVQHRYMHDLSRSIATKGESTWTLQVNEEPEAGSPNMISRSFSLADWHDLAQLRNPAAYRLAGHHIRSGHFFVYGNVVFRLFRVLLPRGDVQDVFEAPEIQRDAKLLDPSGTYMIETSVRLEDRTNSRLAEQASKELLEAKKLLHGSIDLYVPDRLALDTRIKNS